MATIRSTLSLQDNFSNTLNKIANNLNKTQSKFSSFKGVVSKGFQGAGRGAGELVKKIAGVGQEAQRSGSILKSVLGANLISGAISSGVGAVTSGVSSMMGELTSASKAWQTFEGNMGMLGKSQGEINQAKTAMQDYATKTIYSASDMAQTYSQLAAVGIEGTDKLVTGFGGLAAAAENPTQAMKTLSQQAVQMAAKPNVAWADFKLMLEQTPAGISAVAKQMGMSTSEMVTAVQDGKIATKDFFKAISETGNNEAFSKMATEFKAVDQAIDGLKEGLSNKLMPAFEKLNKFGIKAVGALSTVLDKIDFGKSAEKLGAFLDGINFDSILSKAEGAQRMFRSVFNADVMKGFSWALFSTKQAVQSIIDAFNSGSGSVGWVILARNVIQTATEIFATGAQMVKQFVDSFVETGAISSFKKAINDSMEAIQHVMDSLQTSGIASDLGTSFGNLVKNVSEAASKIANFISNLKPETIQGAAKAAAGILKAIIGLKIGGSILGGVAKGASKVKSAFGFAKQVKEVAKNLFKMARFKTPQAPTVSLPPSKLPKLPELPQAPSAPSAPQVPTAPPAEPITQAGNAAGGAATKFMQFGAGLLMVGAGVALVAGGIWILVQAAIALGSAGTPAYIALAVLVGVLFLFGAALYFVGPALTASAVGLIAFGLAILMIGAGIMLAMLGMTLLATQLPIIAQYGLQASVALMAIGVASMVLGVGALVAGLGLLVLGMGLILVGAGALIAAVGVLMLGMAVIVLGAGVLLAAVGVLMLGAGTMMLGVTLPMVAIGAMMAGMGIMMLGTMSMMAMAGLMLLVMPVMILTPLLAIIGGFAIVAGAGFIVLGAGALAGSAGVLVLKAALAGVNSSMKSIASSAASAAGNMTKMVTSVNAVTSGLDAIKAKAQGAIDSLLSAFQSAIGPAQSSGKELGQGISRGVATGIQSGTGLAIASMMMLMTAIRSIGMSGAGMMVAVGAMIGQGLATGMMSALGAVRAAADALVSEAERAAQAKAKIHSPSRLFRDNVGRYIAEGMAVGMMNSRDAVAQAGQGLVDSALPNVGADYAINGIPSHGLGTAGVSAIGSAPSVGSSTESNSGLVNINFGEGSIVVQAIGEAKVDAEALFKEFNRRVKEAYDRGLGYA